MVTKQRLKGNTQLVEYGITKEDSDYRVHVGYKAQHIYVFPTESGLIEVRRRENFPKKVVSLDGKIITARGYAIPISSLDRLQSIMIPHDIYQEHPIHPDMSTTSKGQIAVEIVVRMLKRQLIPLPIKIDVKEDKAIQIQGTDITISSNLRLQVKCDFNAGEKRHNGTGNIFLQTDECNPYHLH